jgi:hypothetical protein
MGIEGPLELRRGEEALPGDVARVTARVGTLPRISSRTSPRAASRKSPL